MADRKHVLKNCTNFQSQFGLFLRQSTSNFHNIPVQLDTHNKFHYFLSSPITDFIGKFIFKSKKRFLTPAILSYKLKRDQILKSEMETQGSGGGMHCGKQKYFLCGVMRELWKI